MSSPPPHHTLFLSTHDFLDVPGSASGECGNNRPERRKRVIFEAVTGSGRLDRFTVVDVGEGVLPINADTTCGVHEEGAWPRPLVGSAGRRGTMCQPHPSTGHIPLSVGDNAGPALRGVVGGSPWLFDFCPLVSFVSRDCLYLFPRPAHHLLQGLVLVRGHREACGPHSCGLCYPRANRDGGPGQGCVVVRGEGKTGLHEIDL